MGVRWEGRSDEFLAKVDKAAEKALFRACGVLVQGVQDGMPGAGASVLAGTGGDTGTAAKYTSSSPGNPPGVRNASGLKNSIRQERVGKLKRRVGTNVKYARIHELGGTINHPGGTPYKIVGPGRAVFVKKSEALPGMKRTRPHPITIPPRPFLKPGLAKSRKQMGIKFAKTFKKELK